MTGYTIQEIAELTGSQIVGDPNKRITHVADLESAEETDASFFSNPRYIQAMKESKAGAVFVHPQVHKELPPKNGISYLLNDDPSRAFQKLVELFIPHKDTHTSFEGIHPTAVIHPTAKVDPSCHVGPFAVIEAHVTIAEKTTIGSHTYVGPYSSIGTNCLIQPHVTIRERTQIGSRVVIQPGAVIGSCGFGYTQDKQGKHIKLNQVGTVVIEDDVEIGANTTIDRSRFKATTIGRGTKIDNLVQIGHGVTIGPDNLIIAQTGVAGSASTGKHVILAGQSAVAGHIHLADGVIVAAKAGVTKSLDKPGKYNGIPALPLDEYNRMSVHQRRLSSYHEALKKLEAKVDQLLNET